ncbi:hypothetical protein G7Y89_g7699 [Cudoniella acicularis]|uniref:DUF7730 domain-containing protein n=1 Tax=Cudoniella acicularis TaxID=354080 RepID=A0A8H4W1Q0_9HELO|nr:hypothetical protein G7Y89_g7699 [Cudoniella acicularis]
MAITETTMLKPFQLFDPFPASAKSTIFRQSNTPHYQPRGPPDFGFLTFPTTHKQAFKPVERPNVSFPVSIATNRREEEAPKECKLLTTIPLEIRLQIYGYVLASTPARHAHLAPLPSSTSNSSHDHKTHTAELPNFSSPSRSYPTTLSSSSSFSTSSQLSKIPTSLLLSCRQIYNETRHLPFEQNVFTFVNWFHSGLYAARQLSRGLREWQIERVRWVEVEVLGRELVGEWDRGNAVSMEVSYGCAEWKEVCGLWGGKEGEGGVRGLSLRVRGSCLSGGLGGRKKMKNWWDVERVGAEQGLGGGERIVLDVSATWVLSGLLQLRCLRFLELEIDDSNVERNVKIQFCRDVETAFRDVKEERNDGWEGDTKVAFVESAKEVVEEEKGVESSFGTFDGKWKAYRKCKLQAISSNNIEMEGGYLYCHTYDYILYHRYLNITLISPIAEWSQAMADVSHAQFYGGTSSAFNLICIPSRAAYNMTNTYKNNLQETSFSIISAQKPQLDYLAAGTPERPFTGGGPIQIPGFVIGEDQFGTTAATWNTSSLSWPFNLLLPYYISLLVALPILLLGTFILHQNGVSAMDGSFIQFLTTTSGSSTIHRIAATGNLGGPQNVPQELKDLKFGIVNCLQRMVIMGQFGERGSELRTRLCR